MSKKTVILAVCAVLVVLALLAFFLKGKSQTPLLTSESKKEIVPSETFIDYSDPAGFSFSYPDNLSLTNNAVSDDSAQITDPDTYASLQLFSKDKSGSLNLRIKDSKFETLDEWLKSENISETNKPVNKELAGLKAVEVKTNDRLMLAALDQGVLFTIEVPRVEEDFWMKVYDQVTKDFTFAAPATAQAQTSTPTGDEVIFEGEEVIE